MVVQAKKPPAAPAPVAAPEDPAPKGQRGGQNRFEPTADQAKVVRAMAAYGIPQDKIAQAIGISKPTLEKHFRETLDIAMTEANAKVAETLFKMATSGTVVAATIYWTKARMGWRDVQAIQQLDENGNPIAPGATFVLKIER
ncbi:MAG TPA: hypothetical protein VMV33_17415 [Rhodocyclaceae bacterium]|nr:hypothetical protein [Rhodocyclaceae bacterium]